MILELQTHAKQQSKLPLIFVSSDNKMIKNKSNENLQDHNIAKR